MIFNKNCRQKKKTNLQASNHHLKRFGTHLRTAKGPFFQIVIINSSLHSNMILPTCVTVGIIEGLLLYGTFLAIFDLYEEKDNFRALIAHRNVQSPS